MDEELHAFTGEQITRLKNAIETIERLGLNSMPRTGRRRPLTPSRVYVGALTSSIPATTALLGKPKKGELNIYTFSTTGVTPTGAVEPVYNFAPQSATTDRWAIAERCNITGHLVLTTQFCS